MNEFGNAEVGSMCTLSQTQFCCVCLLVIFCSMYVVVYPYGRFCSSLFVHYLSVCAHSCTSKMQCIVQNIGQSCMHRAMACSCAMISGGCGQSKMYIYINIYIYIYLYNIFVSVYMYTWETKMALYMYIYICIFVVSYIHIS